MKPLYYQFKFIILGLIILPMCLYLAANLIYFIARYKMAGWSDIWFVTYNAFNSLAPSLLHNLLVLYGRIFGQVLFYVNLYFIIYQNNQSLKMMIVIWSIAASIMAYFTFRNDTLPMDFTTSFIAIALVIFALAGALAAFFMHLLMGKKNTAPSLHDTFK